MAGRWGGGGSMQQQKQKPASSGKQCWQDVGHVAMRRCVHAPHTQLHTSRPYNRFRMDETDSWNVFEHDWGTYQKLVDANTIRHIELFGALQQQLESHACGGSGGIDVLDFGCGDSGHFASMLSSCCSPRLVESIASYTGVDSCKAALAGSACNMRGALHPQATIAHHNSDILDFAATADTKYDVVMAAYSAHHLGTEEKKQLLQLVLGKLLKPGGSFCLLDVFLQAGEQRSEFLLRFEAYYNSQAVLTQQDKDKMVRHAIECDFPESSETYAAWAASHGAQLKILADCGLFKAVMIQAPLAATPAVTAQRLVSASSATSMTAVLDPAALAMLN